MAQERFIPGDMTSGSPARHIILFGLPMMVGGVFQLMYSMVDTAVLGRFVGAGALAAIGATSSTTMLFLSAGSAVTNAMSITVSQLIGAGNRARVRQAAANALYLAAAFGLVIGLIGFFGARPLMELLGTPDDIIGGSVTYKNAKRAARVLAAIPRECAVLETDCPYMAPEPVRGTRNDSRNIAHVAAYIGTLWQMDAQQVLDLTAANARRCFNIV